MREWDLKMGEKKSKGESLGEGRTAVGSKRQGVEDGDGELQRLEEKGLGGAGRGVDILHGLRELVESPHQLHHPLPPGLLHQRSHFRTGHRHPAITTKTATKTPTKSSTE